MKSRRHSGRLFTFFFFFLPGDIQSISEPFWERTWLHNVNASLVQSKKKRGGGGFSKQMVLQYKLIPALPRWILLRYGIIDCLASKTCFTSHLATACSSQNMCKGSINKHERRGEWSQSLMNTRLLCSWSRMNISLSIVYSVWTKKKRWEKKRRPLTKYFVSKDQLESGSVYHILSRL